MPYLQFNPYYSIPAFNATANASEFPFKKGESVTMPLQLIWARLLTPDAHGRRSLQDINALKEATLRPFGKTVMDEELDQCVLSKVESSRSNTPFLLIPLDKENMLQAVILEGDKITDFSVAEGEVVKVPLIVDRIEPMRRLTTMTTRWVALLAPSGEERAGVIVTKVEPVAE